jgi:hypothetical protein
MITTIMQTPVNSSYLPSMVAPCELAAHWNYQQVRSIYQSVLTESFLNAHGYTRDDLKYKKRLPEDLTRAIYQRFNITSLNR